MDNKPVYISPSYPDYEQDRLFDLENKVLNRDGTLLAITRLRDHLAMQGKTVHTVDFLLAQPEPFPACDFYAFGRSLPLDLLQASPQIRPRAFVIDEPPVVAPQLYQALPELTKHFEKIYLHNAEGEGYSLDGVDRSKLHTFYYSQPYLDVQAPFWSRTDRLRRYVMINGFKTPASFDKELYSMRVKALVAFNEISMVDLYGMGWERVWTNRLLWWPYWRFGSVLQAVYRGKSNNKLDTLSRYRFALCFENMAMKGYITEKIFDCFYAGTIPVYLGAPDIDHWIPTEAFVDLRRYGDWQALHQALCQMSEAEVQAMREAGRAFLQSDQGLAFYNGLLEIFDC